MAGIDASAILRPGLLDGVRVALAQAGGLDEGAQALTAAVQDACTGLGAEVLALHAPPPGPPEEQEALLDAAVEEITQGAGTIDVLAVDADALYRAEHAGGRAQLVGAVGASWAFTRALAAQAMIPAGRGGRIVYLAPGADVEHAGAACSALENLARTLSIEWSRHQITSVAIAPGPRTAPGEVAALVAYLASPAGAYFSGCLLDLRGPVL